jgi:hypothetical protein
MSWLLMEGMQAAPIWGTMYFSLDGGLGTRTLLHDDASKTPSDFDPTLGGTHLV